MSMDISQMRSQSGPPSVDRSNCHSISAQHRRSEPEAPACEAWWRGERKADPHPPTSTHPYPWSRSTPTERAPPLDRLHGGDVELGAAWAKTARESGRVYHQVRLDDPSFPTPIFANLVSDTETGNYALIWNARSVPPSAPRATPATTGAATERPTPALPKMGGASSCKPFGGDWFWRFLAGSGPAAFGRVRGKRTLPFRLLPTHL